MLDFAGGTVVHINAGVGGARRRARARHAQGLRPQAILPHNVPFALLGAGLLWFGWFGFNAGSALARERQRGARVRQDDARADGDAGRLDAARRRAHPARDGGRRRDGIVVGLVVITPAAGFVSPIGAIDAGRDRRVPELLRDPLALAHAAR